MRRITPAFKLDNPEKIRQLVGGIVNADPESAEKLVILLRLVTNEERSQTENWCALHEATSYAFSLTNAFSDALDDFVREPLKAVA